MRRTDNASRFVLRRNGYRPPTTGTTDFSASRTASHCSDAMEASGCQTSHLTRRTVIATAAITHQSMQSRRKNLTLATNIATAPSAYVAPKIAMPCCSEKFCPTHPSTAVAGQPIRNAPQR